MNFIEYPDRDMMMIDLADVLASELANSLMTHDAATLAVPGGTTPGPVFDALCAADLEWDKVTVLLTDERWVPEDSPRSNTGLLRDRLFSDRAAKAKFFSYYSDGVAVDAAAAALSEPLQPHLPVSVLLLGMGADMHTASLFPGGIGLEAALDPHAQPLLPISTEAQPEPRLTLTAPVLRGALSTHVLITGAEKRAALEQAVQLNDPTVAPISLVLKDASVHWAE